MPSHAEKRIVPYSPEQMYALVADVQRYPEYLPWLVSSRILKRDERVVVAALEVGFKMVRERFVSHVTLNPPDRIEVKYLEGPFKYLNNHWTFHARPDGGCEIEFYVDFEFRSRMLQMLMGVVFQQAVQRMVSAFEARAQQLYGRRDTPPAAGHPTPPPGVGVAKSS